MTNMVEPNRHMSVFSPESFGNRRIDIVGCGATGSRIAMELAKLGVTNLHLWDFDKVESHNVANQLFGLGDVGKSKVVALGEEIKSKTGLECTLHDEAVTGRTRLGNVVFLLTDTMASRKEIWEGAIRYKPGVEVMLETRMGASEGRIYSIRPTSPPECRYWEGTLCDDEEASDSLCGARVTVNGTAVMICAHAVWAFIRWFRWTQDTDVARPELEVISYIDPPMIMACDNAVAMSP